jgi:hypothetical protein
MAISSSFYCNTKTKSTPLKGKLIVSAVCGNYVIQVLEGRMDSDRLVSNWENVATGYSYTNVFTVSNYCAFASSGLSEGDVFEFEQDPYPPALNCSRCEIFVPTPSVQTAIKNIKKLEKN